jgi:hypothetical protein
MRIDLLLLKLYNDAFFLATCNNDRCNHVCRKCIRYTVGTRSTNEVRVIYRKSTSDTNLLLQSYFCSFALVPSLVLISYLQNIMKSRY